MNGNLQAAGRSVSRRIYECKFFFNLIFNFVVSGCKRIVMDEECAISRDGFDDGGDGLQKRAQGVDALIENGINFVAELNEDGRGAERLEHVSG